MVWSPWSFRIAGGCAMSDLRRSTDEHIGAAAMSGARITGIGQVLRISLQAVSIVLLARLLSPGDYGVMAMAMVVVTFAEVVRDFGLASAAVQAKDLSRHQQQNLFWLNAAIGLALTLLMMVVAPVIASAFDEPRLVDLSRVLGLTFVLNGLSAQFVADLARRLRFTSSVIVSVCSQACGLTVGVVSAALGSGYLALGYMSVSSSAAALLLAWGLAGWFPRLYRRGVPMRGFFRFGGGMLGAQLLGAAAYQAHSVVLGATLGASQLGLYSRAQQLINLPLNQLQAPATRVALPVLSRVQDDSAAFLDLLRKGQTVLLHVTAFVIAVPAAIAPVLLPGVLGDQWTGISGPFRILAVAGIANMGGYVCFWIYLAQGLTSAYFTFSLWARPLMIAAVVTGGFWGVSGVAVAFAAVGVALWPLNYWWLSRRTELEVWPLFGNAVRIILVHVSTSVAGAVVLALASPWGGRAALLSASVAVTAGYLAWAASSTAVRRDARTLRSLWRRGLHPPARPVPAEEFA